MERSERVSSYQLVEDAVTEVIRPLVVVDSQEERRLLMWINSFAASLLNRKDFPYLVYSWKSQGLTRLVCARVREYLSSHGIEGRVEDLNRVRDLLRDPALSEGIHEDFRAVA